MRLLPSLAVDTHLEPTVSSPVQGSLTQPTTAELTSDLESALLPGSIFPVSQQQVQNEYLTLGPFSKKADTRNPRKPVSSLVTLYR